MCGGENVEEVCGGEEGSGGEEGCVEVRKGVWR